MARYTRSGADVKPVAFDYSAPESVDEALQLLAEHGGEARVLAGGQSLIPLLNLRLAQPSVIVDINRLRELDGLECRDGTLWIRAVTRESIVERSSVVADRWPLLREASRCIGHDAIRNRGTVGGSAAHADPSGELPAALTALNARFHAASARGSRVIAGRDFFVGHFTSALHEDELLVQIEIPPLPSRTGTAFVEFARKHGDFALAGAAVCITLDDDGRCRDAAIALLAASIVPLRCSAAEAALTGQTVDSAVALEAAARAATESDPPDPADYRRALIERCVEQAVLLAAERARG